jgi:hypothetical protein
MSPTTAIWPTSKADSPVLHPRAASASRSRCPNDDVSTMERIFGWDWHLPRIRRHDIEQNRTVHAPIERWAPLFRRRAMTNYPLRRGAARTPLRAIESPMPNGSRSRAAASQCNLNCRSEFSSKIALKRAPLRGQCAERIVRSCRSATDLPDVSNLCPKRIRAGERLLLCMGSFSIF